MSNSNPDERVDALLMKMFADDPAQAVMSQPKVTTQAAFSLDAPPVLKNTSPASSKQDTTEVLQDELPSPFIEEPSASSLVAEDGSIDWSDESENLVEIFDIIQAMGFKYVAQATEAEKEQHFSLSEKDKKRLAKFTAPIAKEHNIRVPKELSAITVLAEIMARNTSKALDMRNEKQEKKKAAALKQDPKDVKLKIVKDLTNDEPTGN